jgi:flagellum-specific peptidoglycan hydrolase FlgJ
MKNVLIAVTAVLGLAISPKSNNTYQKSPTEFYDCLAERIKLEPTTTEWVCEECNDAQKKFIEKHKNNAILEYIKYGVPPSIRLEQVMRECGLSPNGEPKSQLAKKAKNYFGIKFRKRHKRKISFHDDCGEDKCSFAKFNSYWESSRDYSQFMAKGYKPKKGYSNYKNWNLNRYSTTPGYTSRVHANIEKLKLYELDQLAEKIKNSRC